jgi:hypothetical protein
MRLAMNQICHRRYNVQTTSMSISVWRVICMRLAPDQLIDTTCPGEKSGYQLTLFRVLLLRLLGAN